MATNIGKYAMMFSASATGVETGVRQAERALGRMQHSTNATNSALAVGTRGVGAFVSQLAGLAAGVVSVNMLSGAVRNAVSRIDELGDKAEGIDDVADNLAALDYAAVRMGASSEAVGNAISKMNRALGDASMGKGRGGEMIRMLGLDLEYLLSLRPTEAFVSIASAIATLPTVAERAAVAQSIFGKGATELNAVLKMGGEDLANYLARYEELNASLSEEAVAAGSRAADSIQDVRAAYDGFMNTVIEKYGPAISTVLDGFANWIAKQNEAAKSANGAGIDLEKLAQSVNTLADAMSKVVEFTGQMADGFGLIKSGVQWAGAGVAGFLESTIPGGAGSQAGTSAVNQKKLDKWMLRDSKEAKEIQKLVAGANEGGTSVSAEMAKQATETANAAIDSYMGIEKKAGEAKAAIIATSDAQSQATGQSLAEISALMEEQEDILDQQDKLAKEAEALAESMMTPWEKYEQQMGKINAMLEQGAISQETYTRAAKKYWDEMTTAQNRAMGVTNTTIGGDMPGMAEQMGGGIDPMLQAMIDYSMPRAGFVGGSIPDNFRLFTPPEMGPRQSVLAKDVLNNASVPYMQSVTNGDPEMIEQTNYLRQIANNTANSGAVL